MTNDDIIANLTEYLVPGIAEQLREASDASADKGIVAHAIGNGEGIAIAFGGFEAEHPLSEIVESCATDFVSLETALGAYIASEGGDSFEKTIAGLDAVKANLTAWFRAN